MSLPRWSMMMARQSVAFAVITLIAGFGLPYAHAHLSTSISQAFSKVTADLNRGKNVGLGESSARQSIKQSFRVD